MSQKIKRTLIGLILPVGVVAAWIFITNYRNIPAAILPKVGTVGKTFVSHVQNGRLWGDLSTSLLRVLKGYLIATVIGILLGTLMGFSKTVDSFFSTVIHMIRQIPMMAWIPLIIMWCGIGETSKVVVIVMGAFFPILMNTITGISSTSNAYVEAAELYGLSKAEIILKVYLPSALPQIFTGLKLGLGSAWMGVVAAEMLASSSGMGFRMTDARSLMQPEVVIVYMITIGVVGVLMNKLITVISMLLTPWLQKR